jgi:hypothetical protein
MFKVLTAPMAETQGAEMPSATMAIPSEGKYCLVGIDIRIVRVTIHDKGSWLINNDTGYTHI